MLTIESKNGWFRATVADADDGVAVTWRRKLCRGSDAFKLVHQEVIDAAFHWVCDDVAARIDQLQPEFAAPRNARVFADLL